MRQDIEFEADGVTLRGWLYTPDGASGPVPTVVMAHGFSAVKEMYLDRFAEAFAGAGLARARLRQPQLRRERRRAAPGDRSVGAGARLPRRHHLRRDARGGRRRPDRHLGLELLRRARAGGRRDRPAREVRGVPGAARLRPRQLPGAGAGRLHPGLPRAVRRRPRLPATAARRRRWCRSSTRTRSHRPRCRRRTRGRGSRETHASRAPAWRNEVTLRSVEMFTEYEPGTYLPWISPTPLLMCVAEHDVLTPADLAIAAFARAQRAEAARDPAGRALRRLRRRLRRRGRCGDGLVRRAPARAQRARRRAVLPSGRDGRRRRMTRRPRARGEHPGRGQSPAGVRRAGACGRR